MAKKILVVDDDKGIVNLLYKLLTKEGFIVFIATDGKECLKLASEFVPDLIILDVIMPEMDGGEVAMNLLEDQRTKDIPVIFLTGAITEEEVIKDKGQVANRLFMSKASNIGEQIKIIKKTLGIPA